MAGSSHRELLFEKNPLPMYVVDLDTLAFLDVNQAAIEKYGYSREELLRMTAKDIRPPEDIPALLHDARIHSNDLRKIGNWRHLKKDGTLINVEITTYDFERQGRKARLIVANDITERKRAEDALRAERRVWRALLDHSPDYIYAKDTNNKFLLANLTLARRMGAASVDELLGKSDFDYYPPDVAAKYAHDEQQIMRSGQPVINREESAIDAATGQTVWHTTSEVPFRDEDGKVLGLIGIGHVVTERKQAEDALRAERELLRTMIDNMPDYIYVKDTSSRFLVANQAVARIMGARSVEELLGKSDFDFYPQEIAAAYFSDEQAIIQSGQALVNHEEKALDPEGNPRWTLTSKVPFRNNQGQTIGIVGIGRDITERKQAEDALRESNQTLRALVDASPAGIVCVDHAGNVTMWNPAAESMFGWSEKELLGQPIPMVPEERRKVYYDLRGGVLQGESVRGKEVQALRKDGSTMDVILAMAPLRDAAGEIRGAMDIAVDITSRKLDEVQLRLQATALESVANSVVISDSSGNIMWVNPAFTVLTGYSAGEAIGKNFSILNSGKHPKSFFEQMWKTIGSGKVWHGEIVNRRKDGSLYTEEQTITPVRNEAGKITRFVTIEQDITERKRMAQQLNQAQKMESIGRLAGGVAHDFNNLLTVVISYSDVLLEHTDLDPHARKQAEEIKKAGNRAASLTRQLLAFSRQQMLEPRVLNLNAIVTDTEKMLRRLIGEDVELLTKLDPNLGSVKADPGQIEQIIMNLAVNARDAMPQGGKIIIETADVDWDEEYARRHTSCTPGRYVLLSMTDTGIGMDQETKAHIFEPFFTTKELGKGTGLGLSTVYGIVKQSGGYVWVYSEPEQGSAFKIYLPRVDAPAQQFHLPEPASVPLRGWETILVVEDDEALRTLARTLLRQIGYTVLEAKNGSHAIEVANQHSGPIHLLLIDLVMPKMNGSKVAEELVRMHPEAKLLYMSGYSGFSASDRGLMDLKVSLLQKPFSRDALLRKVREVLDVRAETKPR